MKTIVLTGMEVEYNVPDNVKIKDGEGLSGYATLRKDLNKLIITKEESTERKLSNITKFTGGKNVSLSFNTDNVTGRGYITLRSTEDWEKQKNDVIKQVEDVYQQLLDFKAGNANNSSL